MLFLLLSIAWAILGLTLVFKFWTPWLVSKCRYMSLAKFMLINWATASLIGVSIALPLCFAIIGISL